MSDENERFRSPERRLNIPNYYDLPKEEELQEFKNLREVILRERDKEVVKRISSNPIPDEEELSAGAYRELLEPQCRKAIFEMRRKGYDTASSGFGSGNTQVVDGLFPLDQPTVDELVKKGYVVYEVGVNSPSIQFRPSTPDIEVITNTWDELAKLLPDLGAPARPHCSSLDSFSDEVLGLCRHLGLQKDSRGGLLIRVVSK
ncbi:MAG: hypothetical protein NUV84_02160 [Candidatus Uhrbacteria bacterium]|nr:hypothetical protein [Candidatus Uhrbacteria bacterium]